MSIRKMTFSLASLIFLIAFGLVFVTTPVIANDETGDDHKDAAADGTTADPATGHAAPAGADGVAPQFQPGHMHPTASIAVTAVADRDTNTAPDADPNMMVVDGVTYVKPGDGTNATQIPLRVTLSANIATGEDIPASELTITARRRDGTQVTTSTIITGGGTGALMTGSMTVFDGLYLDIPADATGVTADDTATTVDESYLEVFVRVNTGAVLTPAITATVNDQGAVVGPFVGVGNIMAATTTKVIVVNEFPTQRPTVTIDVPDDAMVDAAFTVTLTFSEAVSELVKGDIDVMGAVAGDPEKGTPDDGTVWTVEITPTVGATSVEVGVMDAKAIGMAQTVTAPPTVTITVPDDATVDAAFTVTLTFSEAVSELAMGDIDVMGGVAGTPAMGTPAGGTVWTVVITPTVDATSVEVGVMAAKATGMAQTVTATTPEDKGLTLDAKAYLVIVGDGFDGDTLPGVTPTEVDGFPADLAAFFVAGGTVDVVATGGDVIINELMVARDSNKIGALPGEPTDGQWIELYNKHATAQATNIMVTFDGTSKPATTKADGSLPDGVVDRLSNVAGQGWNFEGKFGAAVLTGSTHSENPVNFVSIRRSDAGKNGWDPGAWSTAVSSLLFAPGRVGTPGGVNTVDTFNPVTNRTPARSSVTISEVANRMDDTNEWIELKGPAGKSLKNWKISIITQADFDAATDEAGRKDAEKDIFVFPNNDNIKISPNGRLLLTDKNPEKNELAADYANGVVTPKRYKNAHGNANGKKADGTDFIGALPNEGDFVLILRSDKGKTNHEKIEDIAGYANLAVANPYTKLWPLTGDVGRIGNGNRLNAGKVYARVRDIDGYSHNKDKPGETAFAAQGWTGIGYDRNADADDDENGGTPGHPRGALKGYETLAGRDDPANPVIISEIMYATGHRANTPQWIELYNTSKTEGISLDGWRVVIINHDKDLDDKTFNGDLEEEYNLSGRIPPGQTFLLVAYPGRDDTRLPSERIHRLRPNRGELILSQYGFEITLQSKAKDNKDANRKAADKAGNLATVAAGEGRARTNPQSYEDPAWELPMGVNEDGDRVSIVRGWANGKMVNGQIVRSSDRNDLLPGTMAPAWTRFDMSGQFTRTVDDTSYGHGTDLSSPGHTIGGALPVSLSKFRPERMKDTGQIVIRWITESELNNAGFNILRSEKRDGEFTKINTKLIAGQGTTTERTAYEYADTSAKPNVVYYYQIQDVSFDGQVTTLRTTHLRGNVTAVGKATTTWGEIKALQ